MISLHLTCKRDGVDLLSAELWDVGTAGVQEIQNSDGLVTLIAAFDDPPDDLLLRFKPFSPNWRVDSGTDWVKATHEAWPPRPIGSKLFLAASWSHEPTPVGRKRVVHNPGCASGTGEHPCTQLALEALERCNRPGAIVADVGTGSGILAIAALQLGAGAAIGLDLDESSIRTARDNFELNGFSSNLVVGSTDCLQPECADIIVANLNATVLLAIADELLRIARPAAVIVLTGFPDAESAAVAEIFPPAAILTSQGWSCVISTAI